jgi:type 1 glutamine amidotransferase
LKAWKILAALALLAAVAPAGAADTKILFLAGPRDHGGPGRHEYERDLRTLAQSLERSTNQPGVTTQLLVGSLPRDLEAVKDAAAIVIDSSSDRDAAETHPLYPPNPSTNGRSYDPETTAYLQQLDELIKSRKIGVVIFHYSLWAENWAARRQYLAWTGGLWVQGGSKNPVDEWTMTFETKKHPILRGVKPWTFRDEVFCRFFLPTDVRRTHLLLASPKEDKLKIGPQIASWTYEREDGGRSFVFGGLDFRDNLARDDYRKFLLNGISWAARLEVPKKGVESPVPDVSDVSPPRPRPVR